MTQNLNTLIKGIAAVLFLAALQGCNATIENKNDRQEQTDVNPALQAKAVEAPILFAETGGRKIAYRSIGKGEPIILCQRFRGNLDNWDPAFLDALAEKGYQVIIFDYTGFASSTGNPATTALGFANDVRDLAAALGFKKIIVGGWSIGGLVAQIVTTEMPELVSQTILIGTKPPGKVNHLFEDVFMKSAFKVNYDFNDEIILFFEPASEISRRAAKKSYDRIAARTTDKDIFIKEELWPFYLKCAEDYMKDPYGAREKLMQTKIPVLVISPDHEICFPPENWFELNRKLPTTQVVVIPQSGHGVHHQYPEMVAGYIHTFISNNKEEGLAQ